MADRNEPPEILTILLLNRQAERHYKDLAKF